MAIELTREQLAKVQQFSAHLKATTSLPNSIINYRVNNFRRTLSLDMQSYRPRANHARRQQAIADGKVPSTIVPNPRAARRLEARVRAFEAMKATEQAAHTRPGSLSR